MEELREVTYQYTNCPDPVESEARRQRVLDGEVNGLMEQTAATILAREREMQQEYINARAAETGDGAETGEEIDMVVEQNTTIPLEVPIELPLEPQQSKRRENAIYRQQKGQQHLQRGNQVVPQIDMLLDLTI
ncbi:hypothetical protein Rs2_28140 [Raphanus sativus]|nr:hypothetical protein Rs2_28140 [Raphanus sativus]